ncbi:MAG TPA: ATP-binding cassette domain-containing protein [Steroidobacteraceae bacterium]|nr:ATP-binding cassette domain-containing protein [Steroidobacteraceae bacterium]
MIEAQGLHKRFGQVAALSGVGFRAQDGRITGLLGPNGAGKSTTLRILYATLAADAGTARVDGQTVSADNTRARQLIGVLPHNAGLYPALSARENIEYFGRLAGLSRAAARARADELIELLDMQDIATRRAKGFSQGQKIRTALARALVHAPRNLILDEPTNGLDVPAVRKLRALLVRLRDAGHCILFSSHVMQEVAMLCDEAVVIAAGRVVATGTPEALRERAGAASFEDAFVALTGEAGA